MKFLHKPRGYSLVEVVVYTALVVVVGGVTAALTLQMVLSVGRTRASLTALDNARRAMDVITRDVSVADSVYTPTSEPTVTDQLSVRTRSNITTTPPLPYSYIDFFLENGILYKYQEGDFEQITSDNSVVTDFTATPITGHNAVKVSLTVQYDTERVDLQNESEVTLHSTITMRSYDGG